MILIVLYLVSLGERQNSTHQRHGGLLFISQPHSKLNKFPKVRDLENELFLNTLSWVEFLRPRFCVFENVEGFVSFNLKAAQKDKHTVHGGIEKGGIKLLVRTLLTLGYVNMWPPLICKLIAVS